jgi:hypothetical protein
LRSETSANIEFTETAAPNIVWYTAQTQLTVTVDASTQIETETIYAAQRATVVQANTKLAQQAEILYLLPDPDAFWNGYVVATNAAQSGTRFTITPSFSTRFISPKNASASTTSSTSESSLTVSTTWRGSTTASENQTVAYLNTLPNETLTIAGAKATTTSMSWSALVLNSNYFEFGRFDAFNTSNSNTTSGVTSYFTIPTAVSRQYGLLTFETTIPTTSSASRIIATGTIATVQRSTSSTQGVGNDRTTTASGHSFMVEGIQTVYGSPQISITKGNPPVRSRFATSGVVINGSTGLWFDADVSGTNGPIVETAYYGIGRRGKTILPTTNEFVTVNGESITWKKSNYEESSYTTSSLVARVAGSSVTMGDEDSSLHNGAGGAVGRGCTVVDVGGIGAYKDQMSGTTTAFYGAATVLTESQIQPAKKWVAVQAISPPSLRAARHGITFSEARNSTALPPAMTTA